MRLPIVVLLLTCPVAGRAEEPVATVEAEPYRTPNRVYVRMAGFGGPTGFGYVGDDLPKVIGGLYGTAGAELGFKSSLTLGFEIAPFTWISQTTRPSLSARIALGWARKKIALALEAGSTLTWLFPQLGATPRVGALDGTWARMRISWAIYPAQPVPSDLDLEISTPVAEKLRAVVQLGGVYGGTIGAFASAGVAWLPSGARTMRGGALTVGLGLAWMQWSLGPMVSIGYERRL